MGMEGCTRSALTGGQSRPPRARDEPVIPWEYLIVALPAFEPPMRLPGFSPAVATLNEEGGRAGRRSA